SRGRTGGRRRPADGPADRRGAVPGRAGRLAARPADAVRWPRPRPVVARARVADRREAGRGGPDDLVGRRHRDPPARLRGRARRRGPAAVPGPRGGRGPRRLAGVVVGAVRVALPGERDAGTAAAAPPARDADAALAAAPAGRRPARGRL